MRLCVVSGTFHPEPGGPPTFLYRLLPEIVQRGHSIHVITYGERDAPTNYPYTVTRISRRQPIFFRLIQMTVAILNIARTADAIFVSDYGLPVAFVNLFLRKPIVIRVVADFAWEFAQRHGWINASQSVDEFQTTRHTWRVQWLRRMQQFYLRGARRVVVPSQHISRLVQRWGITPLVIYNAVDHSSAIESFAEFSVDLPHPRLITVARLTPVKGVDIVLESLVYLRTFYPTVQLLIVGNGPSKDELNDLAARLGLSQCVHFVGVLPIEQVASALRTADVFVLGSRTEGLPHVVLEAMAVGLPVIATNVGGTPEVILHGENGLLVPPNAPQLLANAVKQVLDNPQMANRFKQASETTLKKFSWDVMVADYLALFEAAK